ncbi:helix-turn-helix transcriptional regulator [Ferrimonas pelagia]|uniref:Helix-turn-helix transcriptional regulator n=1 Tax=Ferrimonas pelagia TaxID=1177826 RepID=A0ABP9EK48_9GAMM
MHPVQDTPYQMDPADPAERYPLPLQPEREIYLLRADVAPETTFLPHSHPWGQLNMVDSGVMELSVAGQQWLSPPQYGLWIPPDVVHSSYSRQRVAYRALYFNRAWSQQLSGAPCMVKLSPLLRALVADLSGRGIDSPSEASDRRIARVLFDQLQLAEPLPVYLPSSDDPLLSPILLALQHDPANDVSLATWAQRGHTTERTLARRFQRSLGLSFSDWRSRLRFLTSLSMLREGMAVKEVALELGYSTSSAFIAMFRRHSDNSPEAYRRQRGVNEGTRIR